jgi:hypothetical protein
MIQKVGHLPVAIVADMDANRTAQHLDKIGLP